jgi:2-amino-4-hydroxy-6-hydroxymethyldihydropteridine diphosphokinase
MNETVYLGLGSNIGDSPAIIQQALSAIAQIPGVEKLRVSSLYQTSPVYTTCLKNGEFDEKASQNSDLERATIVLHQGVSEDENFEKKPTQSKTHSSETLYISPIAQRDFINCACALNTTLSPEELYEALHRIEVSLGKTPKEKNAPRAIDIDILLFGRHFYRTRELCIPHQHWQERLFVLAPLSELTEEITVPVNACGDCENVRLIEYLETFPNRHNERVLRFHPPINLSN